MANAPSPWRADSEFCAFAQLHWPDEMRKALGGGYSGQAPTTRLLHRWECWAALRSSGPLAMRPGDALLGR